MGNSIRRAVALGLTLTMLTVSFLVARPADVRASAGDTVPLPQGFLKDQRYHAFFESLILTDAELEKALTMRDPEDPEGLPLWKEVQALTVLQQEHNEYAWALSEGPDAKNFQMAMTSIKKVVELYTGVSDDWGSADWMTEEAAKQFLNLMGWSAFNEWRQRILFVSDLVSLYRSVQGLSDAASRNYFIFFAAQDDVGAFAEDWDYFLAPYAPPGMDVDKAKAFAHHIYVVVHTDPTTEWRKLADKIYSIVGVDRAGIRSVRLLAADGVTPLAQGTAIFGDTVVVRVQLVNPAEFGSLRLDVRPQKEWFQDKVTTNFSNTPPTGDVATVTVKGLKPAEYMVRLRLVTNQGEVKNWVYPDTQEFPFPDFVIRPADEAAPEAPTLTSAKPASDGDSPGVLLTWTKVKDATQYQIYRDNQPLFTTRGAGTSFWNTGLVTGRSYTYSVRALRGKVAGSLSNSLTAKAPAAGTPAKDPRIVVDSSPVPLDVPPTNVDGRLLVPLRAISEALGAEVGWDDGSQTATLTLGDTVVKVTVGSLQAYVNDKPVALQAAAAVAGGRVLVPVRFVAEAFGALVNWNSQTQTVTVLGAPWLVTEAPPDAPTKPPVIDSLSPTHGPEAGGTTVTITGSGFAGAVGVKFGLTPTDSFSVQSDTQITAVAPPGSGAVHVTVTSAAETSMTGDADYFTYDRPGQAGASDPLAQWHFRTTPIGNMSSGFLGVAYGAGIFVAVGQGGTLLTSSDGATWSVRNSSTTNSLFGVTYAANTFVAVGDHGTILTSPDGVAWTNRESGTTNELRSVTYGAYTFVAVADWGVVLTSPDGINWTSHNSGAPNESLDAVTYGANNFVAVGVGGGILTSPDGVNWFRHSSGMDTGLWGVAYGSGIFVAVAQDGTILNSPDGKTWTRCSSASLGLTDVTYGANTFMAVGQHGTILTSPDGTQWLSRSPVTGRRLVGVAYGANTFVTVGDWGEVYQSEIIQPSPAIKPSAPAGLPVINSLTPTHASTIGGTTVMINGRNFTGATAVNFGPTPAISFSVQSDNLITAIAPPGSDAVDVNVITAIGISERGSTTLLIYDDPLAQWSIQPPNSCDWLTEVTYAANTFVAVGANGGGYILTSPDGVNWTSRNSGTPNGLWGVTYGANTFVAVGNSGTILTSPDGIRWTSHSSGWLGLLGVTHGPNTFVAVGGGTPSTILTSSDGVTWANRASGTTNWLNGVTYGAGMFVAVGEGGTILTSPDGATWTSRSSGTTTSLTGITYGPQTFVAVGQDGTILTSPDGANWTKRSSDTLFSLNGVTYSTGFFVAVGDAGVILTSTDGIKWTSRSSGTTNPSLKGVTHGANMFMVVGFQGDGSGLKNQSTIIKSGTVPLP